MPFFGAFGAAWRRHGRPLERQPARHPLARDATCSRPARAQRSGGARNLSILYVRAAADPDMHSALKLACSGSGAHYSQLGVIQCASGKVTEERVAFFRKGFRVRLKLAAQLLFEPLPQGLIGGQPSFRVESQV